MLLIAIDGSLSAKNNASNLGLDARGRPVGKGPAGKRSCVRTLFERAALPKTNKHYFAGPGVLGGDTDDIYRASMQMIERAIVDRTHDALALVGYSRGAAIVAEIAEGLADLSAHGVRRQRQPPRGPARRPRMARPVFRLPSSARVPTIRFLGLFDSVAMAVAPSPPRNSPAPDRWGDCADSAEYIAHVLSENRRCAQLPGLDFAARIPTTDPRRTHTLTIPGSDHGAIGSDANHPVGKRAYTFIVRHAGYAGLPIHR